MAEAAAIKIQQYWRKRKRNSLDKFSEEYNEWHTLDDELDIGAILRGIHNIQENGGSANDEKKFMNSITSRFGHNPFDF